MKDKLKVYWYWVWTFLKFPFVILFSARYVVMFKVGLPAPYQDRISWVTVRVPWYQRWYKDSVRVVQEQMNELEKKYPGHKGLQLTEVRRIE